MELRERGRRKVQFELQVHRHRMKIWNMFFVFYISRIFDIKNAKMYVYISINPSGSESKTDLSGILPINFLQMRTLIETLQ